MLIVAAEFEDGEKEFKTEEVGSVPVGFAMLDGSAEKNEPKKTPYSARKVFPESEPLAVFAVGVIVSFSSEGL
jgi:hypothetical protein